MRRYEQEKPSGDPVPFDTINDRRNLIGKKIEWNERGWLTKFSGTIDHNLDAIRNNTGE